MEKLTVEENAARASFIMDWVDNGRVLNDPAKFGVNIPMTVQDICNAHVETLKRIGTRIKKEAEDKDPEFGDGEGLFLAETRKDKGVPAERIVQFIKLTIKRKKAIEFEETQMAELARAQRELDGMKTPSEKKRELTKKVSQIKASLETAQ